MRLLLAGAAVCGAFGMQAQQTRVLTADKSNEYGLVYTLPVTGLRMELTAVHESAHRGPFYQYAAKYLGDASPVTADSESWWLESVRVAPYGAADTETQYLMQLKPGSVTTITVAEDGMLLAINGPAPEMAEWKPTPTGRPMPDAQALLKEYLKYVTPDFVACKSTAMQAKMLAETLMEVRDARLSLTRGTADTMPTDGKQLELMLNSLEKQEQALTAAFAGVRLSERVSKVYETVPEGNGRTVLCRISDFDGFTTPDDLSGRPVYLNIEATGEVALPVDAKGEEKKLPKDAVVYNIPGAAQVTLSDGRKTMYDSELQFAQFGVQFGLVPTLFSDKREPYSATFNPVTGAVVEINALESLK